MEGIDNNKPINMASSEFKNCAFSINLSNLNVSLTVLARTYYENQGVLALFKFAET